MKRETQIKTLTQVSKWDILIIGGGASGLGAAVDAASRGFKTVLFEGVDFAKGTSSRSTKLVHGGVRYLAQGHISLVREALEERGLLAKNARHLFKNQTFIIPNYKWWEGYYYAIGLKIYDKLSKRLSLGKSKRINKNETIRKLPTLQQRKLKSSVTYQDGQFDDARLAVNLAKTAIKHGATVINHMKVTDLLKDENNNVVGVKAKDSETGEIYRIMAQAIINATGIFTNKILKMNDPRHKKTVVPSQGIHLVLDSAFLNSNEALMIPKTLDGRVLFAIPWHGKIVVGTTDTLIKKPKLEPQALEEEIEFVLETVGNYLTKKPTRKDVLSVFAGLRPLAAPKKDSINTKEVSRGHKISVSETKLITIIGGKWTTYRKMAQDTIDKAIEVHNLPRHHAVTKNLSIHGNISRLAENPEDHLTVYGSDLPKIEALKKQDPALRKNIHPKYNYTLAEVVWSIREEMARTVEDILARRIRLLFLDAKAAIEATPLVAKTLAKELNRDSDWAKAQETDFIKTAQKYILS